MIKKVFGILVLSFSFLIADKICYVSSNDTGANIWENIVESKSLKKWIKKSIEEKSDNCYSLENTEEINQAKELVERSPSEAFVYKD